MDMRIKRGQAEITDVYFDEPGGVSVSGNLRRAQFKKSSQTYDNDRPYRLALASRAVASLKKVARLVTTSFEDSLE